ncbi:protein FLX-like 1 [Manihot esculenta]|uniref:Protein FLC EXPRESSOR n=2 Tax=Manihot esculenta TaxID=3983 RepID=A0A2C9WGF7_MANES|nr:protein FLX-like 1 [Manihot esculenta]KAG8661179.1 hypothetical protein MANES_02G216400v8 [Manihot esculenta]OAY58918.1 hypothetical protein MANES_02G216400v8 [Manihot esculenta]
MAGRNRLPPNAFKQRQPPIDDSRFLGNRLPFSVVGNPTTVRAHHPSTILEDRIAIQHREIQSLLLDNQQLAVTHVALKQELALAQDELRRLSAAAADVKAERDDQVRKVYGRSLQMDSEVRSIDALRVELAQVRMDVEKLAVHRQELTAELRAINSDLLKARTEAQQVSVIKAEIETMQQEIQRGRAAIEYEKKTYASNLEHGKTMEQNMLAVAREIEKLQAELSSMEKRARAAAAVNPTPGYAGTYSNSEAAYGGNPCPDPYVMHQVQGGNDGGPPFVSG